MSVMRAVILAAGSGTRLNGHTTRAPKALLQVGGESLVQRQLRTLRLAGLEDIVVVVGCAAAEVRQHCGRGITYVENERYAETNSLYSLWLARPLLYEGFIVLNCDVLFHAHLLDDLLTTQHDCAAMVEYRDETAALGEEEMKVRVRRGRVLEMSKAMDPRQADGENVGMVRFDAPAVPSLVAVLDEVVASGSLREWAPAAFSRFAARHALWALGTRGLPWIEIDYPEDYERAVSEILPLIDGSTSPARAAIEPRTAVASASR
jgi:choline kinase